MEKDIDLGRAVGPALGQQMHGDRLLLVGAQQAHQPTGLKIVGNLVRQELADAATLEHGPKPRLDVVGPQPSGNLTAPRRDRAKSQDWAVRKVPSTAS